MMQSPIYDYTGKTCVVTGSSSGIGFEVAREFLSSGCNVMLNGRNKERLASAEETLRHESGGAYKDRVAGVVADVRNWDQAKYLVDSVIGIYGKLDVVINNAGGNFYCSMEELTPNGWHATIDSNLTSVFMVSKAAFPHLKTEGGVIINIGSIAACGAHPGRAAYGAAKAGVHMLTATMAYEWSRYRVRAVCIAPGATENDAFRWADPVARKDVVSRVPAGRLGRPLDVAKACLFVCSEDAAYITGSVIRVDGGPKLAV